MKNTELFNTLTIINITIQLKCIIKKKSVKYTQYLIIIIKIITFKTNS